MLVQIQAQGVWFYFVAVIFLSKVKKEKKESRYCSINQGWQTQNTHRGQVVLYQHHDKWCVIVNHGWMTCPRTCMWNTQAQPSFPQRNRLSLTCLETHGSRRPTSVSLFWQRQGTVQYFTKESYATGATITVPTPASVSGRQRGVAGTMEVGECMPHLKRALRSRIWAQ